MKFIYRFKPADSGFVGDFISINGVPRKYVPIPGMEEVEVDANDFQGAVEEFLKEHEECRLYEILDESGRAKIFLNRAITNPRLAFGPNLHHIHR